MARRVVYKVWNVKHPTIDFIYSSKKRALAYLAAVNCEEVVWSLDVRVVL